MSGDQPLTSANAAPAPAPAPVPAETETETLTTTATLAPEATSTTTAATPEAAALASAPAPASSPAPEIVEQPTVADSPPASAPKEAEAPTPTPASQETSQASLPGEQVTPLQELWATAKTHGHSEIWGVTLADPSTHVPSQIVLQKYLNANDGDVTRAKDQLIKTLDWRKQMQPLDLIKQSFSREKFGGLGYITTYFQDGKEKNEDPRAREIFTWNIYGIVKSIEVTFGSLDDFIKWRVALMELAVQELSLPTATVPITADPDADPYKIFQVHDYKGVSFLRQAPQVKAASTATIRIFATAYPELLKEKFFVNVPAVMGFMYGFMKLFVAARTIKKFHPMSNGANLAKEDFGGCKLPLGELLPHEYGGNGADLKTQATEPRVE
ncbi:CRAL-TRIO domain-containing protein [Xylaria nigripes]|nr:CRAL-TRIO domain-containing protein [Xylaria nigripes]